MRQTVLSELWNEASIKTRAEYTERAKAHNTKDPNDIGHIFEYVITYNAFAGAKVRSSEIKSISRAHSGVFCRT
jgi:hypothetical protein